MLQDFDQADKFNLDNPENDMPYVEEQTTLDLLDSNITHYNRDFLEHDVLEFISDNNDALSIMFECIGSESAGNIVGLHDGERVIEFCKFDRQKIEKIRTGHITAFFKILELCL